MRPWGLLEAFGSWSVAWQLRRARKAKSLRPPGSVRTDEQLLDAVRFMAADEDCNPGRLGPDGSAVALHYAILTDAIVELRSWRKRGAK